MEREWRECADRHYLFPLKSKAIPNTWAQAAMPQMIYGSGPWVGIRELWGTEPKHLSSLLVFLQPLLDGGETSLPSRSQLRRGKGPYLGLLAPLGCSNGPLAEPSHSPHLFLIPLEIGNENKSVDRIRVFVNYSIGLCLLLQDVIYPLKERKWSETISQM